METKKSRLSGAARYPNKHSNFTTRRRLPPHARNLRPGLPEVRICYDWPGFKVEGALFGGAGLVLPAGADPSGFDWACLCGRYIFLHAQPGKVIPRGIVQAAFREFGQAGAIAVCCWTGRRVIFSLGLITGEAA